MKVGKFHKLYRERSSQWVRQRDAIEGEDAIKAKGTTYLPALGGQTNEGYKVTTQTSEGRLVEQAIPNLTSYESYKSRALFLNATSRTRDSLTGLVMRRDAEVKWPENKKNALNTIGYEGQSFAEVIQAGLDEVTGVGRWGTLVDMVPKLGVQSPRPYIAMYCAESIVNWKSQVIGDRLMTTYVELCEYYSSDDPDVPGEEFRRVLRLGIPGPETQEESDDWANVAARIGLKSSDLDKGAFYFQEIWVKKESSDDSENEWVRRQVIIPRAIGGSVLREIPWTFFNPTSTKADPEKPPLLDLTVVNLSHYRNSADLEHGLHFTALPQPWASGFKTTLGFLPIGCGAAWVTEEPNGNAGYLEFTGQGLGSIRDAMEKKKLEMAGLGARLLETKPDAGASEAAETVRLRQSGEKSVLTKIALSVSEGLTKTLRFYGMFNVLSPAELEKVTVSLNTDFGIEGLSPAMVLALMQQVQNGLISWPTYFHNMKRGELIPDNIDSDEEQKLIEAGRPEDPLKVLEDQQAIKLAQAQAKNTPAKAPAPAA